ncbi:hypothetical protein [Nocardioides korecus]
MTFTLIAACSGSLAACGGGSDPESKPPPSAPTSTKDPSPSSDPSGTGGPPTGWQDKFTHEQMDTYNAALRRWKQYTKLSNEIYRKGKDTPDARATLQEFSLFWQRDALTLATDYDKGGLRREVPAEPLWTYATSVKPTYVVIVQCTDYSKLKYTKSGDVLDNKPSHLVTPLVVRMGKPKGKDWVFAGSTLKDKKSCVA